MKYTPGPWSINRHYIESASGICRARIAIIDDGAGTNPDANAALIAAAPDILEALEDLVKVLTVDLKGHSIAVPEVRNATAAIAKARGEE